MVQVKDLNINSRKVQITVKVIAKTPPRYNKGFKITEFTVGDPTGTIIVPLWNNDAEIVKVGDYIEIMNGYVSEYKGLLQLNIGRYGNFNHIQPVEEFMIKEIPRMLESSSGVENIPIEYLEKKTKKLNLCINIKEKVKNYVLRTRRDGVVHHIATFLVGDSTGCILFELWDELIDLIEVGKSYCIRNAYTRIFKGQKILNLSRYGKIIPFDDEIRFNHINNLSERLASDF